MIQNLSNGFNNTKGNNISLVDERLEISAMYKGVPQNNIGIRTDVMCNLPKYIGMKIMLRSMAPNIIATDEIGTNEDIEAVNEACVSGVKLLLTIHGDDLSCIPKIMLDKHVFKYLVVLCKKDKPGEIKNIYSWEDNKYVVIN